jgi:hypothetical protein
VSLPGAGPVDSRKVSGPDLALAWLMGVLPGAEEVSERPALRIYVSKLRPLESEDESHVLRGTKAPRSQAPVRRSGQPHGQVLHRHTPLKSAPGGGCCYFLRINGAEHHVPARWLESGFGSKGATSQTE